MFTKENEMNNSKNKIIAFRVSDTLYSQIEDRIKELEYPSISEYGRLALLAYINNEPIGLTPQNIGDIISIIMEHQKLIEINSTRIENCQLAGEKLMEAWRLYDYFERLNKVENILGIKSNNNFSSSFPE